MQSDATSRQHEQAQQFCLARVVPVFTNRRAWWLRTVLRPHRGFAIPPKRTDPGCTAAASARFSRSVSASIHARKQSRWMPNPSTALSRSRAREFAVTVFRSAPVQTMSGGTRTSSICRMACSCSSFCTWLRMPAERARWGERRRSSKSVSDPGMVNSSAPGGVATILNWAGRTVTQAVDIGVQQLPLRVL